MSHPLRHLDRILDPWADGQVDRDRIIAVDLFLMALAEDPASVSFAERLVGMDRVFVARVPGANVAVSWLVADEYVLLVRLRDLLTGDEWMLA